MIHIRQTSMVALAGVGIAAGMLTVAPGAWASKSVTCASLDAPTNSMTFDLPGNKPDTAVHAQVCTSKEGGKVRTSVGFTWGILEDQVVDQGQRWDSFTITLRLKTRPSKNGSETVAALKNCDFTKAFNSSYSNAVAEETMCELPTQTVTPGAFYFADATVNFDIHDGKKNSGKWELAKSPLSAA